ncbi:hypothetical protein [Roseiconus lacunae]|uniref:Uncharacterized protein n=1 Tax=Roseiconus lacunae TaxID=2605694 RepID=A0ABT7PC99_9BACT|nr:hypothetical protein [Roseiconus lacunae]MCD0462423.1 hypothetical protein [Roseiconus lacunae]MDM4013924.1 hypothetical protein [Roseiconus lacunae]WRQ53226.1 hypothetical protein U8335_12025 [Stieleria sp. HD01]
MQKVSVAVCLVAIVLGSFLAAGVNAEYKPGAEPEIITRVYKVGALPIYRPKKGVSFDMLMAFIQSSVSPNDWEAKGGHSTMAPYPQNLCLIVSTTGKNHDKIVDLVERFSEKD